MLNVTELSEEVRIKDEFWMKQALKEADRAEAIGEVPIGAIIVKDGEVIGRGYNVRESQKRAIGHAELLAIDDANQNQEAWRLEGATLYVTLEPCPMCAGAIINARLSRVVYGASDQKAGCAGTLMNLLEDSRFNHQPEVIQGVLLKETSLKLTQFFKALRARKKRENH